MLFFGVSITTIYRNFLELRGTGVCVTKNSKCLTIEADYDYHFSYTIERLVKATWVGIFIKNVGTHHI